jgi:hypothetical protein
VPPPRWIGATTPIGNFFVLPLLSKIEPSISRMRLFGYVAVFVDDVRDDEITIWHCAR